jgi:hypothetical protein
MPRKQRFKPSRKPKQPEPAEQSEATVSNGGQSDTQVEDLGKSRSTDATPPTGGDMRDRDTDEAADEPDREDNEPSH